MSTASPLGRDSMPFRESLFDSDDFTIAMITGFVAIAATIFIPCIIVWWYG